MSACCIRGIRWEATPKGRNTKLAGLDCYVAGSNKSRAIMIIHDLFGWTFSNVRILADHYAEEVGATVYVPDFFAGEILPADVIMDQSRWAELDLSAFLERHSKNVRWPEILECAKVLRLQYAHIGAIGFCYGGWAAFRLGGNDKHLVDCITAAHPTMLEKHEIEDVGVPVQIIAPEIDPQFTEALKAHGNEMIPKLGVPYDYQYFPGLEHGFSLRGDLTKHAERKGMERAKNAVVMWFRQWTFES